MWEVKALFTYSCDFWSFMWKTSVMPWSVIPRGSQSSFDHGHVQYNKKILDEIPVCHTQGDVGQSSFDHAHVESLKKNSRWDSGLSYLGGLIIFWPWTCWFFKKNILGKILVHHLGRGQSSFDHGHVEPPQVWYTGISSRIFFKDSTCA